MRFSILALLFPLLIVMSSCRESDSPYKKPDTAVQTEKAGDSTDDKRLRVLTTFAPLYSFTKNITGEAALVENLLPAGSVPHEYSLSPSDIIKISKAQVIIKNGLGFEHWLDKITVSGGQRVVDTSAGVTVVSNDPHIWLSPRNAVIQADNIRDALIQADPVNAKIYTKKAGAYIQRLETLDREIREQTALFRTKDFVSLHSAFLYFARDYGLRQAAVIEVVPEQEPTPGHMADVIRAIRSNNIKVIFSEPRLSHKVVETLAKDLDLQIYELDPLEKGILYPEWYEVRMRANVEVLKTAMNQ